MLKREMGEMLIEVVSSRGSICCAPSTDSHLVLLPKGWWAPLFLARFSQWEVPAGDGGVVEKSEAGDFFSLLLAHSRGCRCRLPEPPVL